MHADELEEAGLVARLVAVEKDLHWLPARAPLLPLAIPVPLAQGAPARGYPWASRGGPLRRCEGRDARRLSAVIDFSCLCVGDPACDAMVAWTYLSADTRDVFRAELGIDDETWARGRGWALSFGLIALPCYRETNPLMTRDARAGDRRGAG
jgi:hypothetical protein